MAGQVQGAFDIIALMDGTTVNGYVRVENTPLVQRYNKGTAQFIPDFEAMAENKRPVVVAILRDVTAGDVLTPQTAVFKYNGVEIAFGTDGLSTNEGWEGVFKRVADYAVTIGAQSYPMAALRVMKNLVPLSGYDNDRISVSGTVEIGGNSIPFNELSTDVIIQESTGNQYDAIITNDKGSALTEAGESLTETVHLYKDGTEVTDLTGYTFQWGIAATAGDKNLGTAKTQAVAADDVDNVAKVFCRVSQDGSVVATAFDEVTDFSDPYYVQINTTGISGNTIRSGQTATLTPVVVKRSTGEEQADLVSAWTWRTKDNAGADFTLTGKDSATFSAASVQVTYADVKRAGMGLWGYVSAEI